MIQKSELVKLMLDKLQNQVRYMDGVPGGWCRPVGERGDAEAALLKYVADLEEVAWKYDELCK